MQIAGTYGNIVDYTPHIEIQPCYLDIQRKINSSVTRVNRKTDIIITHRWYIVRLDYSVHSQNVTSN